MRLLDTCQWIESVELCSRVVSALVELARRSPLSSSQWDGRMDSSVCVNNNNIIIIMHVFILPEGGENNFS